MANNKPRGKHARVETLTNELFEKPALFSLLPPLEGKTVIDLGCGYGEHCMEYVRRGAAKVVGIDISEKMLEIGKAKTTKQHIENQVELRLGDAAALPFESNSFDAVTVAFGVRNFENLEQGLSEIHRVLKPNGRAVILEFSMPERFPIKQLYALYFKHLLPAIGKAVSKDGNAYSYLPMSVERFPKPKDFLRMLAEKGLENGMAKPLSFGIATLYTAEKQ